MYHKILKRWLFKKSAFFVYPVCLHFSESSVSFIYMVNLSIHRISKQGYLFISYFLAWNFEVMIRGKHLRQL